MTDAVKFERLYLPVPESGCWLWVGGVYSTGYGYFHTDRTKLAHRASWEMAFGPIPPGKWVLHKCDVPCCVNPAHLFIGTPLDNSRDMVRKNRNRKGSGVGTSKLTEAMVKEICLSKERTAVLAEKFGVTQNYIGMLKNSQSWRWLDTDRMRPRYAWGERTHNAKLTEEQVIAIRHSKESQYALAKKYGVSRGTISHIKLRLTWKHI